MRTAIFFGLVLITNAIVNPEYFNNHSSFVITIVVFLIIFMMTMDFVEWIVKIS